MSGVTAAAARTGWQPWDGSNNATIWKSVNFTDADGVGTDASVVAIETPSFDTGYDYRLITDALTTDYSGLLAHNFSLQFDDFSWSNLYILEGGFRSLYAQHDLIDIFNPNYKSITKIYSGKSVNITNTTGNSVRRTPWVETQRNPTQKSVIKAKLSLNAFTYTNGIIKLYRRQING